MSPDDVQFWMEKTRDLETQFETYRQANGAALERVKDFKKNFGIKERSNGAIDIDFDKFAENLGVEAALELRSIIDDKYNVSGSAGDKPKIKMAV